MSAINSISFRTMFLVFFGLSVISFAQEGTITYEPCDGVHVIERNFKSM